jgi:predicted ester cyclase
MTTPDDNLRVCRRLTELVNARLYDRMDELFLPDFVDHNPAWGAAGLADLKTVLQGAHAALGMSIAYNDIFAAGDKVVVRITLSGRHTGPFLGFPPTGKDVSWTSIEIFRLAGGKIAERWVQADVAGLMNQLRA